MTESSAKPVWENPDAFDRAMADLNRCRWKPMPGWLIVKPVETEDKIGSLYIPGQAIQNMTRTQYEVIASGGPAPLPEDAEPETPGHIQPGDWVLAPQRLAFYVVEEDVMFLSERNVWAIIGA